MNIGADPRVTRSGESRVLDLLASQFIAAEITIFDVGANRGDYAVEVMKRLPEARLYCFEPGQAGFQALRRRLSKQTDVRLENVGLSERTEECQLYSTEPGSPLSSLYKRRLDHFGRYMDSHEVVSLIRLDEYCATNAVGEITLLKLDVEGHEVMALRGAGDLIGSQRIPLIQFEFGGANIDSRTYFQDLYYLLNTNYRIYRILPGGFHPVKTYQEEHERFVSTNYLAVARRERLESPRRSPRRPGEGRLGVSRV
jgi:FkbM family methyltransferase